MSTYRIIPAIAFMLLFFYSVLPAQKKATPLKPGEKSRPTFKEIGLTAGMGVNFQTGMFFIDQPCFCEQYDGSGFGYSLGLVYEQDINAYFRFGALGLINGNSINSSFIETESVDIMGGQERVNLDFRRSADAGFINFTFIPYIAWNPTQVFFVRLGFAGSFPLSATLYQTKELLTKTARLSDGSIVNVNLTGENKDFAVINDKKFDEVNSFQMAINPMAGFNISLSKRLLLSPYFMYSIPLNEVSTKGDNFRIHSWRIMFDLRWSLVYYDPDDK